MSTINIADSEKEKYMRRCFDLAKLGLGHTAPNPMVGCVIVHEGRIIGEGYHQRYGEAHAEVNAINSVKDKSLLPFSTLYVNLEPCSHFGKTPPCSDYIVAHKIPHVVISAIDVNPAVSGKGVMKMENSGVKVEIGILEEDCWELNKRFFRYQEEQRPFIILKWAQTLDGFIDIERDAQSEAQPNWITDEIDRMLVHKWRADEQSIMVGTNTAVNDNPQLDVRDWGGTNPVRIVIDRNLRINKANHLFNQKTPTIVFTANNYAEQDNLRYIKIDFTTDIVPQILDSLYQLQIQSVIVEGGRQLLQSFINNGTWDEARVFVGNKVFRKGVKTPIFEGDLVSTDFLHNATLSIFRNPKMVYRKSL